MKKPHKITDKAKLLKSFIKTKTLVISFFIIGLVVISGTIGCEDTPTETIEEVEDSKRTLFLTDMRERLIQPLLEETHDYANALIASVETENLTEAKSAWQMIMLSWQRLEVLQFGPAGVSGLRLGGEDIRDQIYSFPLDNPCRVDQELVRGEFSEEGWISEAPINVIGLDAMERLLFGDLAESVCPASTLLIREGQWSDFQADASKVESQRWQYLKVLADGIALQVLYLKSQWGGEFGESFVTASAPYSSQREAIDQVFAGIYYIDEMIKDLKLGAPAGIYMTCLNERCPELLELRGSILSASAVVQNLETALAVFRGELGASGQVTTQSQPSIGRKAVGLSALLIDEGAQELSTQIEALLEDAITELKEIDSLEALLNDDIERMTSIHTSIKTLSTLMKSQLVTVLNLSVPQEGAGDND